MISTPFITATHFGDPGCPWDFSAERQRLQLVWHYGEQVRVVTRMIVIADAPDAYERKGYTTAAFARSFAELQARFHMPIDCAERPRLWSTIPACRAIVATRECADPATADRLLRRLRVRAMAGELLDDVGTLDSAARDVDIEWDELQGWMASDAVETALHNDMRAARDVADSALALRHKLGVDADDSLRYSAPTWVFEAGDSAFVAPGFQPLETYDVLLATLAPTLTRRAAPTTVDEVLTWSHEPLATAEVAALIEHTVDDTRGLLEKAGAAFAQVGRDGYWSAA